MAKNYDRLMQVLLLMARRWVLLARPFRKELKYPCAIQPCMLPAPGLVGPAKGFSEPFDIEGFFPSLRRVYQLIRLCLALVSVESCLLPHVRHEFWLLVQECYHLSARRPLNIGHKNLSAFRPSLALPATT